MAVPFEVVKLTATALVMRPSRRIGMLMNPADSEIEKTLFVKSIDVSLSVMVRTAVARLPSTALPVGRLNARFTVSSPSTSVSLRIATLKVLIVSVALKVSVPRAVV